jgi:hypothetical protein
MQRILAMAGLYKLIDIHEGLPQEYHLI